MSEPCRGSADRRALVVSKLAEAGNVPPRHDQQMAEIRAWVSNLVERRHMEGDGYLIVPEETSRNLYIPVKLTADQALGTHSRRR
jgi:hypothetical protein